MKNPLRTIVYGITHEHAFGKLATLRRMSDTFELVGVVDDRATATRPNFADHPVDPAGLPLITPGEALEKGRCDLALVETTNADLLSVAARFIERGVPLHCDKPCGEAMEPYRSLVEKCRAKNLPFQIGYMYRGNPAVKWIWDFVRGGGLGEVTFVEADMNHDYQLEGYPEYISSFKGGILYNLGCHLVDLVVPVVRGELQSATPLLGDAPGDPYGSRTACASLMRFDGTDVLLRTSSHLPGGIDCRRFRIDGTNGTIDLCPIERFDGKNLVLNLSLKTAACGRPAGVQTLDFGVQEDRFGGQLAELAAIVRGEKPNDQDYDWDLTTHELTLAACGII